MPEPARLILTPVDSRQRKCCRCRTEKSIDDFHRTTKRGAPAFSWTCKPCHAQYKQNRKATMAAVRPPPPAEKACTKCRETKPIAEFGKHSGNGNGYNHFCKSCVLQGSRAISARLRKFVADYKSERACEDCGKVYPSWVMQFDHREGSEKKFQIGDAAGHKIRGEQALLDEMAKCDLVCANCHAHRTYCRLKKIPHFVLESID